MAGKGRIKGDTLTDIVDVFEQTISALENSFIHVAWDHPTHGPHTLLSHDDKRYAGCRADECEPLYRQDEDIKNGWAHGTAERRKG